MFARPYGAVYGGGRPIFGQKKKGLASLQVPLSSGIAGGGFEVANVAKTLEFCYRPTSSIQTPIVSGESRSQLGDA